MTLWFGSHLSTRIDSSLSLGLNQGNARRVVGVVYFDSADVY